MPRGDDATRHDDARADATRDARRHDASTALDRARWRTSTARARRCVARSSGSRAAARATTAARGDDGGARRRRAAGRRARADVDLHHGLGARAERAIGRETGAYASAASAASAASDADEDAYESLAHVARGCSARAFVRELGTWTTTLSERVRASERGGASGATRAASEALRETLTRAGGLADVPGVRKACSTAIATASSGMVRMMTQGTREGFELATTCARWHPGALRPHAAALEKACAAIVSSSEDEDARGRAVVCLAALPRIAGDAGAWSAHARRVMYAAHSAMRDAFEGAEDGELKRQLDVRSQPQTEALPKPFIEGEWPLGSIEALISMLECLEEMCRARFPCAVPMPTAAAVTLVARALACDGTPVASVPGLPPSPVAPELVVALPRVHIAALGVLEALLETARTTALPQGGRIARALEGVLRASAPSPSDVENGEPIRHRMHARACAHDAIAIASYALGGAYVSGELASAVASFVIQDAKPCGTGKSALASGGQQSKASAKKRKKGGAWGNATAEGLDDLTTAAALDDMSGPSAGSAALEAIKLQTSALRALTAMLTTAGAMLAPGVRSRMDVAISQAIAQVCDLSAPMAEVDDASAERRDAAFDALLASVLAPRPFRSPNLPLAVAVFAKGSCDPQTSKKCAQAALAINALLHPSAPPLASQAIAPPVERMGAEGNAMAPQWASFALDANTAANVGAADALRASVGDYYKTADAPTAVKTPRSNRMPWRLHPSMMSPSVENVDMENSEVPANADATVQPAASRGVQKRPRLRIRSGRRRAGVRRAKGNGRTTDETSSPSPHPANKKAKSDMWDTNPEPVGLGSGKSKVVMELSDDSDGELPEIHSGDDEDERRRRRRRRRRVISRTSRL